MAKCSICKSEMYLGNICPNCTLGEGRKKEIDEAYQRGVADGKKEAGKTISEGLSAAYAMSAAYAKGVAEGKKLGCTPEDCQMQYEKGVEEGRMQERKDPFGFETTAYNAGVRDERKRCVEIVKEEIRRNWVEGTMPYCRIIQRIERDEKEG